MSMNPLVVGAIAVSLMALTGSAFAAAPGPAPVELGDAGNFVILTKTGITDVPTSKVTGNVGTSPITGAADLLQCSEVTGTVYSDDAAGPKPCNVISPSKLTAAVLDMEEAYTNAAGRSNPDFTELGTGKIGGKTLVPGLYKWGTGVEISTDVTLSGGADDVWIFQIAGNLTVSNGVAVHLRGGAQAKNVFWQVGGNALFGTTSHFEGIVLSKTLIAVRTGASISGRLYAQTAVTLEMNVVTQPEVAAEIQTPAPNSTLGTTNVTFTWNAAVGASQYELFLGSNGEGSTNLYQSGRTAATTVQVASLPADGSPVSAFLCSELGGAWQCSFTTYKESGTR